MQAKHMQKSLYYIVLKNISKETTYLSDKIWKNPPDLEAASLLDRFIVLEGAMSAAARETSSSVSYSCKPYGQ